MNVNTYIVQLPDTVRGFVVREDYDSFTIYINNKLTLELQQETYEHEMKHINNDDFNSCLSVSEIEKLIVEGGS